MVILERDVVISHQQEEDITALRFPEALDVPVYDNLAHFVRETLRRK